MPGRRLRPVSVILLWAVWLIWPASAAATRVTFDPAVAPHGTEVEISGDICLYQGGDTLLFSDRFIPQLPDGSTGNFRPVAVAPVTPVGGTQTEYGTDTSIQEFTVPRLPAGDYYLYLSCMEADACCVPLEPTFRVLAVPDTSTEQMAREDTGVPLWVLSLAFTLGLGVADARMRSGRPPTIRYR